MHDSQQHTSNADLALKAVAHHSAEFSALITDRHGPLDAIHVHHAIRRQAYLLNEAQHHASASGYDINSIRDASLSARNAYRQSCFVDRVCSWPRGYPGDHETIRQIMDWHQPYEASDVRHYLQNFVLSTPIAQQHRQKVFNQTSFLNRAIRDGLENERPFQILTIGAGYAPDLAACAYKLAQEQCHVVINDIDKDASSEAGRLLTSSGVSNEIAIGNCIRVCREMAGNRRQFDAIVAGGLFDYLDEDAARLLLRMCFRMLERTRGTMFFTNILAGNPYKYWMECIASWHLIERSASQASRMVADAGGRVTSVRTDETGLALLIEAKSSE